MADYTTTALVKADMNKTGAGDDTIIAGMITEASRLIDRLCHRPPSWFVAETVASVKKFAGTGKSTIRIPECTEITLVRVKVSGTADYDSWAATDWMAFRGSEKDPDYNTTPYTGITTDPNGDYSVFYKYGNYPTVEVTAKWGYATTVPEPIAAACKMQVIRWYKRRASAMADALTTGELGQLIYTKKLDPEVEATLYDSGFASSVLASRFA